MIEAPVRFVEQAGALVRLFCARTEEREAQAMIEAPVRFVEQAGAGSGMGDRRRQG